MDFERFLCTTCYGVELPCILLVKREQSGEESKPGRCPFDSDPFSDEYAPVWRKVE